MKTFIITLIAICTISVFVFSQEYNFPWQERVTNAWVTEENTIIIEYVQPSNIIHLTFPETREPDAYWRDVYGVVDGKITKIMRIDGKFVPGKEAYIEWGE
jgi:hypothetical protein